MKDKKLKIKNKRSKTSRIEEVITLAHGSGGRLMHELVKKLCRKFSNKILNELSDAAELKVENRRLSFSTDSYVVKPLFFPGGDIGKLAVCGTVNDISMKGARPLFISLSFIIEEGFKLSILEKISDSIRKEAKSSDVAVVTGDIKVVEKGAADKLFINTSGIGVINYKGRVGSKAKPGDVIIINGPIAEHGLAILNARQSLGFKSRIKSDCRNLSFAVARCLRASKKISVMRDPTRGGLATTLNEIALSSNLGIEINEKCIPITISARRLCDILGFDPLYIANEGKFVCFVDEKDALKVKKAMGRASRIIGRTTKVHKRQVFLKTGIGSDRILPMLEGEPLPRIC
ncbi:MAG: hydrogenase expression/formation protein HypE [Candidatus Omnitrophica bacterium]|nr:hydrogenase expression/formation protein HypE [Candidatus Omnitrophota bacterium]